MAAEEVQYKVINCFNMTRARAYWAIKVQSSRTEVGVIPQPHFMDGGQARF